jgi:hypothetical protein
MSNTRPTRRLDPERERLIAQFTQGWAKADFRHKVGKRWLAELRAMPMEKLRAFVVEQADSDNQIDTAIARLEFYVKALGIADVAEPFKRWAHKVVVYLVGTHGMDERQAMSMTAGQWCAMLKADYERKVSAQPDAGGPTKRRRTKRRRTKRRQPSVRPLTPKQHQAVELYAKHNGSISKVAAEMNVKHPTAIQHLQAAWGKMGHVPQQPKGRHKHTALPTDDRGQVAVRTNHRIATPDEVKLPARRRRM